MGKGRGAEKTSFQRFLDESYFSFVFLNWALALGISGIALIIIGKRRYSCSPPYLTTLPCCRLLSRCCCQRRLPYADHQRYQ